MQRWNDFWVLEFAADAEDAHTIRPLSLAKVVCVISVGMHEAFSASAAFRAKAGCTVVEQPDMQQTVNNPLIQFQYLYDSRVLPSPAN